MKTKKIPSAPCKDCTDREIGCHGKCEQYQEYRRAADERIQANRLEQMGRYCPLACMPAKERSQITTNRRGRF